MTWPMEKRGSLSSKISLAATILFFWFCCSSSSCASAETKNHATVIIVGAGMSGVSAAKTLSEAGITDFLILEGTDRVGGRIWKQDFSGVAVEVGANWVEGVGGDKVNPIWEMAENLTLKTFFSDWDNVSANSYKQTGELYNATLVQDLMDLADEVADFSTNLSNTLTSRKQDDISILVAQRLKNRVPSTTLEMAVDWYYYDYEYAEPPRVTSLQNTAPLPTFEEFGEDSYFVGDSRGFESVVHYVGHRVLTYKNGVITDPRLLLNKVVVEIRYSPSGVIIKTEDGSVYRSEYVMVSASIGVLQTNLINFQPDLPLWKLLAIYQFDMAVYTKIFVKFPSVFWPTGNGTEFFMYVDEKRGYYPAWQQFEKQYPGSNVLLVTVTDDESRRIELQPDSETKEEIMGVLRNMFGPNIPNATDILVPKWWSNRFFKGAFSNWPIGVNKYEYDQISAPVGRVYFTGEHTSHYYNGYVHGAYFAGIDSANMLVACAVEKNCTYTVTPKARRT